MPQPGWYPDPSGAVQLRFWDGVGWTHWLAPPPGRGWVSAPKGPALDEAVAAMRGDDPAPWGWRPAVVPIAAFVVVIVAGQLVSAFVTPSSYGGKLAFAVIANGCADALLALAVWVAGREVAARYGGWGRAFGLRRPRAIDLAFAAGGFVASLLMRGVVAGIANGLTHGRAAGEAQNLHLNTVNVPVVIILGVVTVIAAPVIEEIVFRGLLLRTFMRRMGFWPAAALSTLIFAGFHTYEVDTLAGAITLAASVGCLGLVNCFLNRYTDRLGAGMVVHATSNLLAVIVLVSMAGN
jgi:membrane protease YdiL (CAAX protease family)